MTMGKSRIAGSYRVRRLVESCTARPCALLDKGVCRYGNARFSGFITSALRALPAFAYKIGHIRMIRMHISCATALFAYPF